MATLSRMLDRGELSHLGSCDQVMVTGRSKCIAPECGITADAGGDGIPSTLRRPGSMLWEWDNNTSSVDKPAGLGGSAEERRCWNFYLHRTGRVPRKTPNLSQDRETSGHKKVCHTDLPAEC